MKNKTRRYIIICNLINEVEYVTVFDSEIRKDESLDSIIEWFDIDWKSLEDDGEITNTDDAWRKEGYIVSFTFRDKGIEMAAGLTEQELANQPTWTTEDWKYINDEQLEGLVELATRAKSIKLK